MVFCVLAWKTEPVWRELLSRFYSVISSLAMKPLQTLGLTGNLCGMDSLWQYGEGGSMDRSADMSLVVIKSSKAVRRVKAFGLGLWFGEQKNSQPVFSPHALCIYFNNLCFSCLNWARPGEQAVLLESFRSFIPSRFQWEIKSTASPLLNSDPHCVC